MEEAFGTGIFKGMNKADLYSFWISAWQTGESCGYTSGGGPGLSDKGIDVPVN